MVSAGERRARSTAELLAGSCAEITGGALRSVVLHGSLAAGGFRPGRSDIDVLAVVAGGLADDQAAALERAVRQADLGGAAGLDVHVVTAEVAGAPTRQPALELHVGRSAGPAAECEVERRTPAAPDLLTELSMARAHGIALRGADSREVIAPVPDAWVVDRGRHWLLTWRSLTGDTRHAAFMVLTACRIWRFAVEHVHCAKAQAAAWALDRDPSLSAVRQALQQYEHEPASPIDERALADLLDTVLDATTPATPSSPRAGDEPFAIQERRRQRPADPVEQQQGRGGGDTGQQ
ncbi:aminoglycoside adenylyltransferase domain-containing protein [Actinoplanes sp. NPDC049599]|uniref:aminoglycoside adenylyltransferase domain-containing protein n=1 Tax=Actinoplanes sp. NPDC049599 TaxID=3363903 RepID=UPI0037ADBC7B